MVFLSHSPPPRKEREKVLLTDLGGPQVTVGCIIEGYELTNEQRDEQAICLTYADYKQAGGYPFTEREFKGRIRKKVNGARKK